MKDYKIDFFLSYEKSFLFKERHCFFKNNGQKILQLLTRFLSNYNFKVRYLFKKGSYRAPQGKNNFCIDLNLPANHVFFSDHNFWLNNLVDENNNSLFISPCSNIDNKTTNEATYYNPFIIWRYFQDKLNQFSGTKISSSAMIEEGVTLTGKVIIGSGVKILRNAVLRGPCVIGKNTIIGNGSLVRGSWIEKNCVVGFNTEIARSYIGEGSSFHCNFIGDSIIGDNCFFGYGTYTSSVRLDEKKIQIQTPAGIFKSDSSRLGSFIGRGCRLGGTVAIMPGAFIGEKCKILPLTLIKGAIKSNSFVTAANHEAIMVNDLFPVSLALRKKLRAKLEDELAELGSGK